MALLSKGITLGYKGDNSEFVTLTNLQEIAELGNNAPEKVDVTTLGDDAKKSIAGLADTAQDLPFKFIYDRAQFEQLAALNESTLWLVTLPDGMKAYFYATPSVKVAGVGVSAPLAYTLTLSVESKIEWGEPPASVKITIANSGYEFEGGTYTVAEGTTWGEFATTYGLEIENTKITAQSASAVYLLDSAGEAVKTSDVIVAGSYGWS